jgi:SAM-dependent methyltransferase
MASIFPGQRTFSTSAAASVSWPRPLPSASPRMPRSSASTPAFQTRSRFVCTTVDSSLDWADASFDLVVASYSLYFFPNGLPEMARVLRPHGVFLAVTHTESSCRAFLRALGLPESGSAFLSIILRFSAENGQERLAPWFETVERVDYANAIGFGAGDLDDLLQYLQFKLPLLSPDLEGKGDPARVLEQAARRALARSGRVTFEKGDAAFRCTRPKCR